MPLYGIKYYYCITIVKYSQMTDKEITNWMDTQNPSEKTIVLDENMFKEMTHEQADLIVSRFGGKKMIKLPPREIVFFEWVKKEENAVWKDLWEDDDISPTYIVSINLLPNLIYSNIGGFPICDLVSTDNYYFSNIFMQDEESKIVIDVAKSRFLAKKPLSVAQKLAMEISYDPIDIWHFAYRYKIDLQEAKKGVEELVEDMALVHLRDIEHLSQAISISND